MPRDQGHNGVMLDEHETGREYVLCLAQVVEAHARGDTQAEPEIGRSARGCAMLLWAHIDKQHHVVCPLADRTLSEDTNRRLAGRLESVENERVVPGRQEGLSRPAGRAVVRIPAAAVMAPAVPWPGAGATAHLTASTVGVVR